MVPEHLIQMILNAFVDTYGLVSHHRESYDNFVRYQIPEIVLENSPVRVLCTASKVLHVVHLSDVRLSKPVIVEADGSVHALTPTEACVRRQTYSADVFANVRHEVYKQIQGQERTYALCGVKLFLNVLIFKVPAMRMSSVCTDRNNLDASRATAGCLIINGYEKVIISQEKLKCNYPYCFEKRGRTWVELRSHHPLKIRSTSTITIDIAKGTKGDSALYITVAIPFIKADVPVATCFRMLGVDNVEEIVHKYVAGSAAVNAIAREAMRAPDQGVAMLDDLYDWVGLQGTTERTRRKRVQYVRHVMHNEFLPHYTTERDKAFCLGYLVRRLIALHLKEIPPDDIDSYKNKRVATAGTMLALLTRQLVRNFFKMLHLQVFRAVSSNKHVNMTDYFLHHKISAGLKYACSTGNWGISRGLTNQSGVCQVLSQMNRAARLSHMRLVNKPLNRDGKDSQPRQLHRSHWGLLCCAETPEGRTTGLLNSFAMLARVRVGCPSRYIIAILQEDMGVVSTNAVTEMETLTIVMVNGIVAGFCPDPVRFCETYRQYRRWHAVPVDSCVCFEPCTNQVCINTDGEDCYRPLLVRSELHKLELLASLYKDYPRHFWQQLLVEGVIEFVNKEEEDQLCIHCGDGPPSSFHTHVEIHASSALYGVAAGTVVFSNHNQGPRNVYSSAMMKQSISTQMMDFGTRFETRSFVLECAQKPLATTWVSEAIGLNEEPAGQPVVMAILSYTGFNQEDSLIFNRASLERGLFSTAVYRSYREVEATHGADTERFEYNADDKEVMGRVKGDYSNLDPSGIIRVGSKVHKGTVLMCKTVEFNDVRNRQKTKRDRSVLVTCDESGRVEKVVVSVTKDGLLSVTVRTISVRVPEVGDKFASKNGQKGVVGRVIDSQDMPFTTEGISPDVILNPHAIPSRMTVGHLLEALFGKAACMEGKIANGTPHRGVSAADVSEVLKRHGMHPLGKEQMFNGQTGKPLHELVNMGVIYYQRLRHCVEDKIHGRSIGPKQILTRQPVEGRSRNGGLRIGEMERDALICHGASGVVTDRYLNASDKFKVYICKTCGAMADPAIPSKSKVLSITHQKPYCRICDSNLHVSSVHVPYAWKLLTQELAAAHVGLRYTLG